MKNAQTVGEKVNTLHEIINTITDTFCPVKKVRIHEYNPPWETETTAKLPRLKTAAYEKRITKLEFFSKHLTKLCEKTKENMPSII